MSEIKCNISEVLNKKGMTQRELADAIGTTEVSISRYVSGERIPKATTCIQIAKVLGCNVEDLYILNSKEECIGMKVQQAIEELKNSIVSFEVKNHNNITCDLTQEVLDMAIKALEKQIPKQNDEWISIDERLPDTDKYILLSFSNFSIPIVGRYEEDEEGNGYFYIGDEVKTCLSQGLFVNAWMYLPEPYRESEQYDSRKN